MRFIDAITFRRYNNPRITNKNFGNLPSLFRLCKLSRRGDREALNKLIGRVKAWIYGDSSYDIPHGIKCEVFWTLHKCEVVIHDFPKSKLDWYLKEAEVMHLYSAEQHRRERIKRRNRYASRDMLKPTRKRGHGHCSRCNLVFEGGYTPINKEARDVAWGQRYSSY